jgi:hypothetical protein
VKQQIQQTAFRGIHPFSLEFRKLNPLLIQNWVQTQEIKVKTIQFEYSYFSSYNLQNGFSFRSSFSFPVTESKK